MKIHHTLSDLLVMSPGLFTPLNAIAQQTRATPGSSAVRGSIHQAICQSPSESQGGPKVSTPRRQPLRSMSRTPRRINTEDYTLNAQTILRIRNGSCSRANFAKNMVEKLFNKEERCNVKGVLGKQCFDVEKMAYVKSLTFEHYPAVPPENISDCWSMCVRAIDTAGRQLIRKFKKENISQE